MNMSKPMTGGCPCGAVRYKIDSNPLLSFLCHCRQCQQATGSPSTALMIFSEAGVRITGDVRSYETTADSGNTVERAFCPSCGGRLFGRSSGYPENISITVCSLDDPASIEPEIAIFTESAPSWDRPREDLPNFPTMPPDPGDRLKPDA